MSCVPIDITEAMLNSSLVKAASHPYIQLSNHAHAAVKIGMALTLEWQ